MPLHDLPPEILLYLTTHLTLIDAKSLRLTNKLLARLACERVFSCSLRVLRLEATADSARRVGGFLSAGEDLKALVRGLVVRSCCADLDATWPVEGDWRGKPGWDVEIDDDDDAEDDMEGFWSHEYGYMHDVCPVLDGFAYIPLEVSRLFKRILGKIGGFARLNWVKVECNRWTKPPHLSPKGWNGYEYKEYRNTILRKVFRALNHYDHSAGELRSLAIVNLHELVDLDIMTSNDFKAVTARLDTLELSIGGSEHSDERSSGCIKAVEAGKDKDIRERILQLNDERTRRAFFPKTLRKYWLAPVQQNLVHLNTFYWGYHPTCDLRGVYFPSLKSLALNKWTFTHAWQFHWILSHGDMLSLLSLDNCPIVHDVFVASELDDEGYPIIDPAGSQTNSEKRPVNHRTYSARWHEFFRALKAGLPRLKRFAFESGADDDGPLPSGQISPSSPTGWPGPHDDLGYYPEDDRLSDSAVGGEGYSPQSPSYSPISPGYQPTSPPLQGLDSPPPAAINDSPSRGVPEGGGDMDASTTHDQYRQRIHVSFTPGDSSSFHLPARLHPHRYIVFNSDPPRESAWVKPWCLSDGSGGEGVLEGDFGRGGRLSRQIHEECREEDQKALDELLEAVKGRGRVSEWA